MPTAPHELAWRPLQRSVMFTPWTALEFLASKVTEEARRQNVPFSDLEEKMLYFSEVEKSLPNILDVAQQFDAVHDNDEYEAKVSRLFQDAYDQDHANAFAAQKWRDARTTLQGKDYYVLIMLDSAVGRMQSVARPAGDQWRLFATALAVAAVGFSVFFAFWWARENLAQRTLMLTAVLFLLLFVWVWAVWGKKPFERARDWLMDRLDRGSGE